ncbi:hypothetical protein AMTRI_Chr06g198390 [Amborella trichopoda]
MDSLDNALQDALFLGLKIFFSFLIIHLDVEMLNQRREKQERRSGLAAKEFIENLKILEGALGDKPFFGGEKLGFVDVAVVPSVCWFHAYEVHGGFSVAAEYPKIEAWVKHCMENDSVSKVMQDPEKVLEFVGVLKKKYGVE